jgi:hypothetical protein
MEWVRLDCDFFRHPRTGPLSANAKLAFLRALCWCGEQENGWTIPRGIPGEIGISTRTIGELVKAGCWELTDSGWHIRDAEHRQPDLPALQEAKRRRSDAGRKGAETRWQSHWQSHSKPDANAIKTDSNAYAIATENRWQSHSTLTNTLTSGFQPPPTNVSNAASPAADFVAKVVHGIAARQLAAAKTAGKPIRNESAWLNAAKSGVHRNQAEIIVGLHGSMSVDEAVDKLEPLPKPKPPDPLEKTGEAAEVKYAENDAKRRPLPPADPEGNKRRLAALREGHT